MNDMYGTTLEAVRQERAARSEIGLRAPNGPGALNFLVRSASHKNLARVLSLGVVGILLASVALVVIATMPSLFGYHIYTINGDAMEPALRSGDAAITKVTSTRDLETGNVIVRSDNQGGQPLIHRIVDVLTVEGQVAFVTQGDQNNAPDAKPVILTGSGEQVIYRVPYLGYPLSFAGSWPGRFLLVGVPLVLLAMVLASGVRRTIQPASRAANAQTKPPAQAPAIIPDVGGLSDEISSWTLRRFVLRHSGDDDRMHQCTDHPPIASLATLQVLAALTQETGITATSQRLAETCAELGVPYARAA